MKGVLRAISPGNGVVVIASCRGGDCDSMRFYGSTLSGLNRRRRPTGLVASNTCKSSRTHGGTSGLGVRLVAAGLMNGGASSYGNRFMVGRSVGAVARYPVKRSPRGYDC